MAAKCSRSADLAEQPQLLIGVLFLALWGEFSPFALVYSAF